MRHTSASLGALALVLAACAAPATQAPPERPTVKVSASEAPLARQPSCDGRFAARQLDFTTGARMREIATYESNGAGLAAGDLDGDGDLDLAFASVDGNSAILWNEGGLRFRTQELDDRFTRAVAIVDADGDGRPDIAFTHRSTEGVSLWRSAGPPSAPTFVRTELPGVGGFAYSMAWGDLAGDTGLDLVTGAYDADLRNHGVAAADLAARGGVVLYTSRGGRYEPRQLSMRAEALSIGLVDFDGDGRPDILAANDFALPDGHWASRGGSWAPAEPFRETSHSTMGVEWGDIANDGRLAIFTTDMNPGDVSTDVLADWLPMMSKLEEKHGPSDPQLMANTLQVGGPGAWRNEAAGRGVDATGWSWSAALGDLDGDGLLDLYVVNGMIARNLFGHLPGGELVERNRAFRNQGAGVFRPADDWGLGSTASGRGAILADMDGDGDLDAVVANLRSRAQLFENRLCGGDGLEVDLDWPGSGNSAAVGAQLELVTSAGVLRRDVRAASGYLSGPPPRVHFGVPAGARIDRLVVRYPDGQVAVVEGPRAQTLLRVTRSDTHS